MRKKYGFQGVVKVSTDTVLEDYDDVRLDIKPKVVPRSIRLTERDDALCRRLAEHIGVSMSDVVRMGLRELAEKRGVKA